MIKHGNFPASRVSSFTNAFQCTILLSSNNCSIFEINLKCKKFVGVQIILSLIVSTYINYMYIKVPTLHRWVRFGTEAMPLRTHELMRTFVNTIYASSINRLSGWLQESVYLRGWISKTLVKVFSDCTFIRQILEHYKPIVSSLRCYYRTRRQ